MMWLLWAVVRMAPQKDPGDAADLEAVRRMADGDGQALALLYDRHARVTYSLVMSSLTARRPVRTCQVPYTMLTPQRPHQPPPGSC